MFVYDSGLRKYSELRKVKCTKAQYKEVSWMHSDDSTLHERSLDYIYLLECANAIDGIFLCKSAGI